MEQNSKKVSHLDLSHAVFNSVSKRLYGREIFKQFSNFSHHFQK